jgi:hypothetical protein
MLGLAVVVLIAWLLMQCMHDGGPLVHSLFGWMTRFIFISSVGR